MRFSATVSGQTCLAGARQFLSGHKDVIYLTAFSRALGSGRGFGFVEEKTVGGGEPRTTSRPEPCSGTLRRRGSDVKKNLPQLNLTFRTKPQPKPSL